MKKRGNSSENSPRMRRNVRHGEEFSPKFFRGKQNNDAPLDAGKRSRTFTSIDELPHVRSSTKYCLHAVFFFVNIYDELCNVCIATDYTE